MSHVLGTARDISVNIENILLFALVGGVRRTLQTYVSAQTVGILCVLLWVADRGVMHRTTDTSRSAWQILLQVNVILLSDSVMNNVSGHTDGGSSYVNMLSLLLPIACCFMVLPALAPPFRIVYYSGPGKYNADLDARNLSAT